MPDSFAISPNNLLMDVNGVDPCVAWDGMQPQVFQAGVIAPLTAPVIAADAGGTGTITGDYAAYVRFVDSRGNYSNFSPVSNTITAASATTITYSALPVPAQSGIVRRQILRNTADQFLVFYVDIDTTDLGSTTLTSTRVDAELEVQEPQALFDTNGNTLANAFGIPPDWKSIIAQHQTRMWLAGEVPYFEGAAIVTFGSKTVTGIGTQWKSNWGGRFFYGSGSYAGIEIDTVDPTTQVITLLSPWVVVSDPYLYYKVVPAPAEKNILYFSQPGNPEAWVATNALEIPEDGYQITGLMPLSSFLYILKEMRIYRLTDQGDPVNDGFIFESVRRGCVNNRCWATVGTDAYMLDYYGIHVFSGGKSEDISDPIQAIFRGTNRNYNLNWLQSRYWHAALDPNYQTIRWFITLGGDYLPHHALCFDYSLKRWWLESYPVPMACSANAAGTIPLGTFRTTGQQSQYFGSRATKVYTMDGPFHLDGPDAAAGTTRGLVASAGLCSLTCTSAEFASAGLIGSTVTIVAGYGLGQTRRIASISGKTLKLTQPWTIRPNTTSTFQIGAVPWELRTGRMTFTDGEGRMTRKLQLGFRPMPAEQNAIAELFADYEQLIASKQQHKYTGAQRRGVSTDVGDAKQFIDLTRGYGTADINTDAQRERDTDAPRRMSVLLYGWNRENSLTIKQLILTGVVGSDQ